MSPFYALLAVYPVARLSARLFVEFHSEEPATFIPTRENLSIWLLYWIVLSGAVFASTLVNGFWGLSLAGRYSPVHAGFAGGVTGLLFSFWPIPRSPRGRTESQLIVDRSFDYWLILGGLIDGLCDELWRACSILAVVESGGTKVEAWTLTLLAFGVGRMAFDGSGKRILGSAVGGACLGGLIGAVYLVTGSIVATVTARVTCLLAPFLLVRGQSDGFGHRATSSTCPRCGSSPFIHAASLASSFRCVQCDAKLRVSPIYSVAAKIFAAAVAWGACMLMGVGDNSFGVKLLAFALYYVAAYGTISLLLVLLFNPHVVEDTSGSVQLFR